MEGEVMKRLFYISLVTLLAFSLLTGCETTRKLTSSITGSSDTDELLTQVPSEEQKEVHEAAFNLQVAEEKFKLAEMKAELASLQKKYADYQEDVADKYQDAAEVKLDLAKLEAVDKANLGEKEDNINKIADLKGKILKIEADKIKFEAKRDTTEQKINDLTKQIEEQETKVINLEAAGVAEPEPGDVVTKDEGPEAEKVSETKTEEPETQP
jgi:chromosome segregation ATPase